MVLFWDKTQLFRHLYSLQFLLVKDDFMIFFFLLKHESSVSEYYFFDDYGMLAIPLLLENFSCQII